MQNKLLVLTSCLILFTSCTQVKETASTDSELSTSVAATIYAAQAASTSAPTPPEAPIPTQTPSHKESPTETPQKIQETTEEVALEGTPIPLVSSIISPANAHDLVPLARWGKGAINRLTFADDGEELMIATTLGIYFLDPSSMSIHDSLIQSPGVVEAIYLENETIIALLIGYDFFGYEVQIWDRSNHKLLRSFECDQEVQHIHYSKAENELLTVGYAAEWWDLESAETRGWQSLLDGMYETVLSPSGNLLGRIKREPAMASDENEDRVLIYDVDTGEISLELKETAQAIAISADDEKLALSSRENLRIYELSSGNILHNLETDSYIYDLAISSDGSLLAFKDENDYLRIWEPAQNSADLILELSGSITWMIFSPNDDYLALVADGSDLSLIKLPERELVHGDDLFSSEPVEMSFHTETEQLISLSLDGELMLRDQYDGSINSQTDLPAAFRSAMSPDGKNIAIWDFIGTHIKVWDSTTRTFRQELNVSEPGLGMGDHPNIETLAFSQNGEDLALGTYDGRLGIWHLPTGSFNLVYEGDYQDVVSMAFSLQGEWLAIGGENGLIRLLPLPAGNETDVLAGQAGRIADLAFSPDGEVLASASSDGTVVLWRVTDKYKLGILDHTQAMEEEEGLWGDRFPVSGVTFSPEGVLLVSWSTIGSDLWLWDVENVSLVSVIHDLSQDWSISKASFSSDGSYLAVGVGDGTIQLWGIHNP